MLVLSENAMLFVGETGNRRFRHSEYAAFIVCLTRHKLVTILIATELTARIAIPL